MGARRRGREHALKVLYQAEIAGVSLPSAFTGHWAMEPEPDAGTRAFAEDLVAAVDHDRARIDELIGEASRNWRLERMEAIERNVLRLAVGEMVGRPDTPPAVVIDEAVELARAYGGSESHAFVNGILEAIRKRLQTAT